MSERENIGHYRVSRGFPFALGPAQPRGVAPRSMSQDHTPTVRSCRGSCAYECVDNMRLGSAHSWHASKRTLFSDIQVGRCENSTSPRSRRSSSLTACCRLESKCATCTPPISAGLRFPGRIDVPSFGLRRLPEPQNWELDQTPSFAAKNARAALSNDRPTPALCSAPSR